MHIYIYIYIYIYHRYHCLIIIMLNISSKIVSMKGGFGDFTFQKLKLKQVELILQPLLVSPKIFRSPTHDKEGF